MAKRIGAVDAMKDGDVKVEILEGVDNKQGQNLLPNILPPLQMNTPP